MKRLFLIGDTHFADTKDWHREIYSKFIEWFSTQDFGDPHTAELIQLGDVFEKAANLGNSLEYAAKFFKIASEKFSRIWIIGGNHDHRLVNEKSQFATQYLAYIGNVTRIYEETIADICGYKVCLLPYRRIKGKQIDEYYSNELPEEFYTTQFDLICGHVGIKEKGGFFGGIDIDKFNAKHRAFGHIHVRNGVYSSDYCGSILPFKIDETISEKGRVIKCLSADKMTEIAIPEFMRYELLKFGEKPVITDDKTIVYTVTNCKNAQQAKAEYPNLYIKGIERAASKIETKTGEKNTVFVNPLQALDSLVKETGLVVKRKAMGMLRELLKV